MNDIIKIQFFLLPVTKLRKIRQSFKNSRMLKRQEKKKQIRDVSFICKKKKIKFAHDSSFLL